MLGLVKTVLPTQCPVCREAFRDPRELPCTHIFCYVCIEGVDDAARRTERPTHRVCPVCRVDLPAELKGLPKAKVGALAGPDENDRPVLAACVYHSSNAIIGCCDTCRSIVCDACCSAGNKHEGHPVIDATEATHKYTPKTLLPLVEVLRNRVPLIDNACNELDAMNATLQGRLFKLNNEITTAFFEAIQLRPDVAAQLEARRDELVAQTQTEIENDSKSVTQQVRSLKLSRDQAFTATRQVDSMVRNPSRSHPYEELRLYSLVFERIKYVTPLQPDLNVWSRDTLRFRFPSSEADEFRSTPPDKLGELYREN